jgi:hypothetical protein
MKVARGITVESPQRSEDLKRKARPLRSLGLAMIKLNIKGKIEERDNCLSGSDQSMTLLKSTFLVCTFANEGKGKSGKRRNKS